MRKLTVLAMFLFSYPALAADPTCAPQDYTKAKPVPIFECPSPLEDTLVPTLDPGPKASVKLLTSKPAPWDGILMDSDRVIQLGLRIKAIRRLRWNDTLTLQDKMAAEIKLVEDSKKADLNLLQSQRESYKQQLQTTQKELDSARAWYRSWTFGVVVGVVVTSATAVALAYVSR